LPWHPVSHAANSGDAVNMVDPHYPFKLLNGGITLLGSSELTTRSIRGAIDISPRRQSDLFAILNEDESIPM
jgi:hypothetical protein